MQGDERLQQLLGFSSDTVIGGPGSGEALSDSRPPKASKTAPGSISMAGVSLAFQWVP